MIIHATIKPVLITGLFFFLVYSGWTHPLSPHRKSHIPGRRMTMTRKSCQDSAGNIGICMFKWDCISLKGITLSTCADGFLFGACCKVKDDSLQKFTNDPLSENGIYDQADTANTILDFQSIVTPSDLSSTKFADLQNISITSGKLPDNSQSLTTISEKFLNYNNSSVLIDDEYGGLMLQNINASLNEERDSTFKISFTSFDIITKENNDDNSHNVYNSSIDFTAERNSLGSSHDLSEYFGKSSVNYTQFESEVSQLTPDLEYNITYFMDTNSSEHSISHIASNMDMYTMYPNSQKEADIENDILNVTVNEPYNKNISNGYYEYEIKPHKNNQTSIYDYDQENSIVHKDFDDSGYTLPQSESMQSSELQVHLFTSESISTNFIDLESNVKADENSSSTTSNDFVLSAEVVKTEMQEATASSKTAIPLESKISNIEFDKRLTTNGAVTYIWQENIDPVLPSSFQSLLSQLTSEDLTNPATVKVWIETQTISPKVTINQSQNEFNRTTEPYNTFDKQNESISVSYNTLSNISTVAFSDAFQNKTILETTTVKLYTSNKFEKNKLAAVLESDAENSITKTDTSSPYNNVNNDTENKHTVSFSIQNESSSVIYPEEYISSLETYKIKKINVTEHDTSFSDVNVHTDGKPQSLSDGYENVNLVQYIHVQDNANGGNGTQMSDSINSYHILPNSINFTVIYNSTQTVTKVSQGVNNGVFVSDLYDDFDMENENLTSSFSSAFIINNHASKNTTIQNTFNTENKISAHYNNSVSQSENIPPPHIKNVYEYMYGSNVNLNSSLIEKTSTYFADPEDLRNNITDIYTVTSDTTLPAEFNFSLSTNLNISLDKDLYTPSQNNLLSLSLLDWFFSGINSSDMFLTNSSTLASTDTTPQEPKVNYSANSFQNHPISSDANIENKNIGNVSTSIYDITSLSDQLDNQSSASSESDIFQSEGNDAEYDTGLHSITENSSLDDLLHFSSSQEQIQESQSSNSTNISELLLLTAAGVTLPASAESNLTNKTSAVDIVTLPQSHIEVNSLTTANSSELSLENYLNNYSVPPSPTSLMNVSVSNMTLNNNKTSVTYINAESMNSSTYPTAFINDNAVTYQDTVSTNLPNGIPASEGVDTLMFETTTPTSFSVSTIQSATSKGPTAMNENHRWNYKKDCGVRFMQPMGRIVGGQNTYFGKWPWQVLVKEATWLGLFVKNKCGGVLITDKYVLTAAHCQPGFLASLYVVLGTHDLSGSYASKPPVIRDVRRMVVHRHYNAQTFENDLALLEMDQKVEFLPHVVPICLPHRNEDFTGKMAFVTGWGKLTHGGDIPNILQEVQVPIVANGDCQRMFYYAGHQKAIRSNFVCAGYISGGQDSCEGDSGGPLMVQREDKRWVLVGTVSHGIGCADPNLPGVYMRMSSYRPWIDSIINK
ncbi:nuclear pore complex protein DDB_G0274915-like [Stegodyphus dumicola]|uniref:nuclear pore complex protein DDB_G0274915-like n=1 Tax=Stegodyphus dumicola TaxID=202533 RepID=UPI0015B1CE17|nr:nuclear pore complex protein DDB_G0274915-like [Stegodyphus dumicola]